MGRLHCDSIFIIRARCPPCDLFALLALCVGSWNSREERTETGEPRETWFNAEHLDFAWSMGILFAIMRNRAATAALITTGNASHAKRN